ncbi:hypothetical protein [Methanococcoides burtonii]|uniref:KilA-N DNA-binding domain-containing protein n=1 Tax=Methanococcoides burtonii (strain DSM 6242 / NBRC 107633 / OCM 468 / ACE-M) TaxID=259564 RepID=Q12WN4_METBU|nr:hypothetical protein [Methanococcoides burtonii]ABE52142.1 Hypothetical protein Mbur_1220 [Methanococcoides burtonii DSM 6242]
MSGRRTKPCVFTEQGVAMLSAGFRNETAVKMSIQIINAFVAMRRFIASNAQVFQRLEALEIEQLETDTKMDKILNAIEIKQFRNSHDRFIIIDNTTVYHFGASLKDLGKKWFAFSKMDIGAVEMLTRLEGMK